MILILMGAPGSGKGSQASLLSRAFAIPHISTGDILRKEVADESEIGLLVKDIMAKGSFPEDSLIIDLLKQRLTQEDCHNGFILDGFPRTLNQAVAFDGLLKQTGLNLTVVIEFSVEFDVLMKRIMGRFTCKSCGEIYNDYFKPLADTKKCDKCSGVDFIRRADDKEDVVENRLNIYNDTTTDVLSFYKNKNLLYKIDAANSPEKVFAEVKEVLSSESVY